MNYWDLVKQKEDENSELYKRMRTDSDLLYLRDYVLRDKDNKEVPDIINVTLNKPAIFAANVISSIGTTAQQTVVESDSSKIDTHEIETFQDAALNAANRRLQRRGQPSLNIFTDAQLCIRGRAARRVLFRQADSEDVTRKEASKVGEIIPDIVSWDTRYVTRERGIDGLEWGAYHIGRSWSKVLAQYNELMYKYSIRKKDGSTDKTDILDVWTTDHNELWIEGNKVKEEPHFYGFCPVIYESVPLGYGDIILDDNSIQHEGESIFFMVRHLVPEMNRLVSLLQTLNQRQLLAAMQFKNPEGTPQDEPPDYPSSKEMISVGKGGLEPIDYGDAKRSAEMIYNILDKQLQQGSISDIDVGNLNFPMSAVALVAIGEGRDQIYLPRLNTKALINQRTAEMLTAQILQMGLSSVELGTPGHKATFKTSDFEGDYETTYKYFVKSPKLDVARLTMMDAALRMGIDRLTVYKDIGQYEDPEDMERRYYYDMAEKLSPNVLKNRVILKLLDMAEDDKNEQAAMDAQILAEEMGASIEQIKAGNIVQPPEVPNAGGNPLIPLMGDGKNVGGIKPTPAMMGAKEGE